MRLLVTGGCGFIGSNFVSIALKKKIKIINIDNLTYVSKNYKNHPKNKNYKFFKLNILNERKILQILNKFKPDGIIHFAAETHVDRSIKNPEIFFKSNKLGMLRLLNASRNFLKKNKNKKFKFINVSTDEVYGSLKIKEKSFSEKNKYFPNSPYSASKASSDHIARAFFKTYNMPIITTNCSNNYGPNQYEEKLIPLIISNALQRKKLPIYGNGKQIRDWLYVDDHCMAILKIFYRGKIGETYNIGGENEIKNIDLVKKICDLLDKKMKLNKKRDSFSNLIHFVKDRPGHDFRYSINSKKIMRHLKWQPSFKLERGLKLTINWYLKKLL